MITARDNNGLHQTGRGGVAFAIRRRPVVEARPAGEAGCSTDPLLSERDGSKGLGNQLS